MTLDAMLAENYACLKSTACKEAVLDFIASTESVIDRDVLFIKKLTKVAGHLLVSNPHALDNLLPRLFQYHDEGIYLIQAEKAKYPNELYLLIMESHFYSHRGKIALAISERCPDKAHHMQWLKTYYESYLTSAELSEKIDTKHASHAYSLAGYAAKTISVKSSLQSDKIKWAKKSYNAYVKSADLSMHLDPDHTAHALRCAGKAALALFTFTGNLSYKNESLRCLTYFIDHCREHPNPDSDKYVQGIIPKLAYLRQYA